MKTRILSAAVGIVLLIVVLSFFQTPILNVAIMLISLIAMHEFLTATKISQQAAFFGCICGGGSISLCSNAKGDEPFAAVFAALYRNFIFDFIENT